MHIWHHARRLSPAHKYGANYGISLSLWDYLFRTAYVPQEGRDIELGFDNIEEFPEDFLSQQAYPFIKKKTKVHDIEPAVSISISAEINNPILDKELN